MKKSGLDRSFILEIGDRFYGDFGALARPKNHSSGAYSTAAVGEKRLMDSIALSQRTRDL